MRIRLWRRVLQDASRCYSVRSNSQSTSTASEHLLRAAMSPRTPSNLNELTSLLISETILHEPGLSLLFIISCSNRVQRLAHCDIEIISGRFVIVNKPFGVSCVGYKQKNGGVFPESRFDRKNANEEDIDDDIQRESLPPNSLTIEAALPFLAERFREPNLSFCVGLKRFIFQSFCIFDSFFSLELLNIVFILKYVSGAVVLPASVGDFESVIKSVRLCAFPEYDYHHRAFASVFRYVSGAVVLPASVRDFESVIKSVRLCAFPEYDYHHRALAICVGKPAEERGKLSGYATFETVRDHSEYIFKPGAKAKLRARAGKYAVAGEMEYQLLASKYGCSLMDISFSKFGRHLPRLMLTELLCPVLGDSMYMRRIVDIDSVATLIPPSHVYRAKRHPKQLQMDSSALLSRLNISRADIHTKLPIFMHVYRSLFPRYGCSKKSKKRVDLVASAPLPAHMVAMLKCLEMWDAAVRHLNTVAEEDSSEKRFASESRF
uniref:Pseudouridine synthase RsuA/RluA-like domain-containing protein n=1 Tax=Ascaris lumbricoides TaxID=6252 RepID=A0A9J2P7P7_ASCLU